MGIKKLDKKNFIFQISQYGFFTEQFPECFNSASFARALDELIPLVASSKGQAKKGNRNTTSPTTLSTYKNDISRRVLSVPNPEAFLRLAKFMQEHWNEINEYAYSSNSLSPITFVRVYAQGEAEELLNSESLRERFKIRSDFVVSIKNCIRASLGYKYRLSVDISNCYNSLYTHSVTWAICGKDKAKEYLRTKSPAEIQRDYEIADCIDAFTRFQKNNETNGIIVGPYTSRIVSEIVLARIDKELKQKGLHFKRYVDDYKMYFRTESQAQESLPIIEKVLNEYNLSLNTSKTVIQKYPYEIILNLKDSFEKAFIEEGVFGVLNMAATLFSSGEKGAYKYALKYIKDMALTGEDIYLIIPTLINIMLIDPRYGKYVTQYLKKNLSYREKEKLTNVFNNELTSSIDGQLQQETLLFIQLIKDLNFKIQGSNVVKILKSDNDFAIIIALDLWKNSKELVIRTKTEAREINKAIDWLLLKLNGEKLSGSRWLLLYEMSVNKLVSSKKMPTIEMDDFFSKMFDLKVSFYNSNKKN
ncbi:MAG: RNA-directed DNA polymerase [Clostridia bacterium]|nr:RNA-directed DNA polymerase [Clostridia bacterium]